MSSEGSISSVVAGLSGGAGIDIRKLAQDLTDVERAPVEDRLNARKDREAAQITAYSVLKYNVDELNSVLDTLDDASDLISFDASSDDTTKVRVSDVTESARAGIHSVSVSSIATQQINISNSYDAVTQNLNGGSGFSINFTDASSVTTTVSVEDGNDTPTAIVSAINAANLGVSASLVATTSAADQYRIVLSGGTGSANAFTVNSTLSDSDLGFHDAGNGNGQLAGGIYSQQLATNAVFTIDGLGLERESNTVTDALEGVTLDLVNAHASGSTQIKIESNHNNFKAKLQNLVSAYNSTKFALSEVSNPDSTDETVGGALTFDFAAVRQARDSIYRAITQDSSTPSGSVTALRDIGIELTRDGDLEFDEVKFDSVMSTSSEDVAMMLSGGTNNQSQYDSNPKGLARDIISALENALTDPRDGLFATRTDASTRAIASYEAELEELDIRMTTLFDRYIMQFTVMETIVSQLNSTRTSLADTWANMGNFNNK